MFVRAAADAVGSGALGRSRLLRPEPAHDAHEPPPPPEPETPLWFTMLGGVLFVAAALAALVLAGDDADPANPDSARNPSAVAVPPPNGAEGDSAAQGNAAPRGVPPVRRLQPGDFEKKRLGPAAK